LSVEAYDRANTKLLATGRLATVDNQIDTTTGTIKLRAMFDNPDELLYPNQFVNARLLVNTMQGVVRVPVPAIQRGEPGTYVYLINDNNTVSVRPVKIGPTDGGFTAVLSGLQPGEKVVTDGTDRLRDGATVTIPSAGQSRGQGRGQAAPGTPTGQASAPGQPQAPGAASPSGPPAAGSPPADPARQPDSQRGRQRQPQTQ
jgi:membrane fusion protein, multidrug efflux system